MFTPGKSTETEHSFVSIRGWGGEGRLLAEVQRGNDLLFKRLYSLLKVPTLNKTFKTKDFRMCEWHQ